MKINLLLLSLLYFSLVFSTAAEQNPSLLSKEEQIWLEKNADGISFAPNPSWPPMDFIDADGHHRGIVADYIAYFEKSLSVKFKENKYSNWSQIMHALKKKEVDFVGAIQETPERTAYLNFTDVYIDIPLFIIVKNDYAGKIDREQLEEMKIAVVRDYAVFDYLKKNFPNLQTFEFDDDLSALLQTSFGKTDGTLIDLSTASFLVEKYGISNLSLGKKLDYSWQISFASIKSKPQLHSILNKVLKDMPESEKKAIHDKWIKIDRIGSKNFWERNLKLLFVVSVLTIVLSIIVVYYNRLLKSRINAHTKKLKEEIRKKNSALTKAKESEENYRALFNNSALPKWIYEEESLQIVEVNEAAISHYGYSREEFLSMTIKDIRPREDIPRLLDKSRKAEIKGLSNYYGVWNHLLKNGDIIKVEVYGFPIIYKGRLCKTVTCKDITQQLQSEKMLMDFAENLERKVEIRTEELFRTHSILIEQHQEITDSINYAKRIQSAIFPKKEEVLGIFPKSFIFLKPKEVVSGDFYWCYQNKSCRFIAVADCTGHGVPGALLSMIGHQLLNQIVVIKKIHSPSKILSELDKEILKLLNQSDKKNGANDGMDMIMCKIDDSSKELYFSGARNPLFFIHQDNLIEVAGSKRSIGGDPHHNLEKNYEEKKFKFEEKDRIYFCSDGYFDQFGGVNNKKITKKTFSKLILSYQEYSMDEQQQELANFFKEWKQKEEQTDDVLVMGIEL